VGEIFAGRNIYAGPAKYAIDGNSYGTIWGTGGNSEWLSNNLNARFGAIPVNNTTGDVNGTAWGGSLAVNLTARFNDLQSKINAIPVDNPSGNIRGSAWGNDWLSNYLSNKFNGIPDNFRLSRLITRPEIFMAAHGQRLAIKLVSSTVFCA
jgi:hypothetical protein